MPGPRHDSTLPVCWFQMRRGVSNAMIPTQTTFTLAIVATLEAAHDVACLMERV